jgi:hypothetical protein
VKKFRACSLASAQNPPSLTHPCYGPNAGGCFNTTPQDGRLGRCSPS